MDGFCSAVSSISCREGEKEKGEVEDALSYKKLPEIWQMSLDLPRVKVFGSETHSQHEDLYINEKWWRMLLHKLHIAR